MTKAPASQGSGTRGLSFVRYEAVTAEPASGGAPAFGGYSAVVPSRLWMRSIPRGVTRSV